MMKTYKKYYKKYIILLTILQLVLILLLFYWLYQIFIYTIVIPANFSLRNLNNQINITSIDLNKTTKSDTENQIIISSINVQSKIITRDTSDALKEGFWHHSNSGNPITGGNMIITAHRYKYLPPYQNTLFYINKIKINDTIQIIWNNQIFNYIVTKIIEISPKDTQIESSSRDNILTLYSCTPLWTNSKRIVIIATLKPS